MEIAANKIEFVPTTLQINRSVITTYLNKLTNGHFIMVYEL